MRRITALVLALLVHALTLAFVVLGVWTIVANDGSLVGWLLGGLLIGVGWVLRPRLGALPDDAEPLERDSARELYALAGRVAGKLGVRRPERVAIRDLALETRYQRVGLTRVPVLVVGLPTWLALSPRQRVTLLAMAYADVETAEEIVVNGALSTLGEWHEALLGAQPLSARQEAHEKMAATGLDPVAHPGNTYEVMGFLGRVVGRLFGWPVLLIEHALRRLATADAERVRARRHALAGRVADEADLTQLREVLALGGYVAPMQAAALRGESVAAIRQNALSRHLLTEDGVLSAAPSDDLLGTTQSDEIDEELHQHYARAIRGFGLIS
ncbi:hypothetical protein HII36_49105 [Nonomuraea sp. NN258]|uniref:hypothetical protein n=1 Tax=Nonomuraea antri TaxID=2730852 RepID=UPI001569CC58|nr:hypothetical protein [Nonomuraea antri]NRQ39738.1 hypothetical protein [Nonomuraea antri]